MKLLCIFLSLGLVSCGGVGTEPHSPEVNIESETAVEQKQSDLQQSQSCSDDIESVIIEVAQFCAANMSVDVNRSLCLVSAESLIREHPNFMCTLESGQMIDADYIQENFIKVVED